jgi:ASC-1-like (ASCH) protein
MKKQPEMLDEYDFSKGVRGKYAASYHESVNIVKIDEDVTKVFPDSKSVNEALRTLMRLLAKDQKTAQSA